MKVFKTKNGPFFLRAIHNKDGLNVYISKEVNGRPSNFWYWIRSGIQSLKQLEFKELKSFAERYQYYYDSIWSIDD